MLPPSALRGPSATINACDPVLNKVNYAGCTLQPNLKAVRLPKRCEATLLQKLVHAMPQPCSGLVQTELSPEWTSLQYSSLAILIEDEWRICNACANTMLQYLWQIHNAEQFQMAYREPDMLLPSTAGWCHQPQVQHSDW